MGDEEEEKKLSIFGKNIAEIPCFRDSYFYGICTGFASGLGYFMFTSRPGVSTNFGMGAFCLSTLSYWSYCRWKYNDQIKQAALIRAYLQEGLVTEGASSAKDNEDMIATV
ncbi:cytochrome c oxidase assembly protein COX20, mitochondrial [Halyomorpha halys]|uniref:cytochrome c oxidase assembly protein COX20, mitochondrial n=1 Tax=Halyomorpha halys TaxID=286706 RepID=UPI0006D4F557|nr:cytochrome c oxidase assembly protein COX20, mitochondrial [Halyomorpha halys]